MHMRRIRLYQAFSRERVTCAILRQKALRKRALVRANFIPAGQKLVIVHGIKVACSIHRAINERDIGNVKPRCQRIGNFHHRALPHAVAQKISTRVKQNGATQAIRPVIVMSQAAKACLNAANDDGRILECLTNKPAIHNSRAVGAQPHFPTRRIRI